MQKLLIFLTIAILCVTDVFTTPVSIDDAIESAKDNNISLDITKLELAKSLRSASTLQSWLLDFSLTCSATTRGSAINQSFTPLSTNIQFRRFLFSGNQSYWKGRECKNTENSGKHYIPN